MTLEFALTTEVSFFSFNGLMQCIESILNQLTEKILIFILQAPIILFFLEIQCNQVFVLFYSMMSCRQ